jgi:F420-dependent oxidoreductase-like protein
MRVCLMVEGQEDVTWDQWVAVARACEEAGLEGMFRSDHYLTVQGEHERGALDAWATLAALAAVTERIRLGTLVSPATFRHPAVVAKMVVTADHVSGGRVEVGLGAGWHEPEHRAFGFPFPSTDTRLEMLEEQLEVVRRSWDAGPFDFHGRHYRLEGCDARPKPKQHPHPNLIVGGSGGRRSLALAATWADEYNTVFASPDVCRERRAKAEDAWRAAGRDPSTLVFSVMMGCVVGADEDDLRRRTRRVMQRHDGTGSGSERDWLDERRPEWIVGTVDEAVGQLRDLEDVGVQRVMLQHQTNDDLAMVDLLGQIAGTLR